MVKKVVVVGGGPAGMIAAYSAACSGARVELLEKNKRLGVKLGITGKGRANITSAADLDEFIASYPGNGRFLYSALHEFSNWDLIDFFASRGLKSVVERGQRVFPESQRAGDVIEVLHRTLLKTGVQIHTGTAVQNILIHNNQVQGVVTGSGTVHADAVIIATGGLSYPSTGSTGDGYSWAEEAGHHIISPRASLVPLVVKEDWVKELQGLSLKNVRAAAFRPDGVKINEDFGEMLFTHFGVSGPIILSMSSDIGKYMFEKQQPVRLVLNLKPALSEEKLDERVLRDLSRYSRRQFKNSLDELLPQKMIPVVIRLSGIHPEKETNQVNKEERKKLVGLLKNMEMTVIAVRPIKEAIVTAGGVDVKEVHPKTMESKRVSGLYFAGEVLDVDGYTGGFNLQAAFSTGYCAGKYAAGQPVK